MKILILPLLITIIMYHGVVANVSKIIAWWCHVFYSLQVTT
jgi:hypothetical protein